MLKGARMGKRTPRVRKMFVAVVVAVVIGVVMSLSWMSGVGGGSGHSTTSVVKVEEMPREEVRHSSTPPPPSPSPDVKIDNPRHINIAQSCNRHTTCSECLSDMFCHWCAIPPNFDVSKASGTCLPTGDTTCLDSEDRSCPAILNTPLPSNLRVIHVGIQKGGPEALIQLHLALIYWGFKSTLDTRKNKQGGNIKSHFRINYEAELKRSPPLRWFDSYDQWLTTGEPEDVFVETETWACKPGMLFSQGKGRQLQWHLTVWKKKNRDACTIAAHTHYIAHDYMEISDRAILYPYISPHIHKLSQKQSTIDTKKENLILYDADAGLSDSDFTNLGIPGLKLAVAKGLKPEQLYEKYAKAKLCIDMRLPGAERFVYEAALFGCPIVTDDTLNGGDNLDLPLKPQYRLPTGDTKRLGILAKDILTNFDDHSHNFSELKDFVNSQRVRFLRQVRRYFSDNAHIIATCSNDDNIEHLIQFLLTHIFIIPFATIEIVCCKKDLYSHPIFEDLRERTLLAGVHFRKTDSCAVNEDYPEVTHPKRMEYVLAYKGLKLVPAVLDVVAVLSTQLTIVSEAVGLLLSQDALFSKSSKFASIRNCWSSCPSVASVSKDFIYRSDIVVPLVGTPSRTIIDFMCKHPVYVNASKQSLVTPEGRCS
eukprot:TRINITY_DN1881_c8_g1_i1.p1 TRINITY_DN1881_c8_g1~~TRINITY_DN1881_c8_g1_i1.p1  ORF type:complete len:650 (+),score=101.76 TRINITY_DN1881_c8_g1_i1:90-2039(+)